MAGISTHILNAALGKPAVGVSVELLKETSQGYFSIDKQLTDIDGRIKAFNLDSFTTGNYQLIFHTVDYFQSMMEYERMVLMLQMLAHHLKD